MWKNIILAAALASASQVHAINKCQAQDGKISYSDAPCAETSKSSEIKAPPPVNLSTEEIERQKNINAATAAGRVFTGMTREEVIRSWGYPTKKNVTILAGGTHEQWIYSRGRIGSEQYLYFDDGILSSMQSPR